MEGMKTFEEFLDKEMEKLKQYFLTKIQQSEEKILKRFRDSPANLDTALEKSYDQLTSLYNIDPIKCLQRLSK